MGLMGESDLEGFLWSLEDGDWPFLSTLIGISSKSVDEDDKASDWEEDEEEESDSICIKGCVEEIPDIDSDPGADRMLAASAVTSACSSTVLFKACSATSVASSLSKAEVGTSISLTRSRTL